MLRHQASQIYFPRSFLIKNFLKFYKIKTTFTLLNIIFVMKVFKLSYTYKNYGKQQNNDNN